MLRLRRTDLRGKPKTDRLTRLINTRPRRRSCSHRSRAVCGERTNGNGGRVYLSMRVGGSAHGMGHGPWRTAPPHGYAYRVRGRHATMHHGTNYSAESVQIQYSARHGTATGSQFRSRVAEKRPPAARRARPRAARRTTVYSQESHEQYIRIRTSQAQARQAAQEA